MPPPVQGFRYLGSLTAAATTKAGALFASCGASRGGGIQLSGTWVGTILFEQSIDSGTTWIAKTVYPAAGGAGVTTVAANGQWKFSCGGETHIRVRCSAFTSGPIVVDLALTAGVDTTVAGAGSVQSPEDGATLTKAAVTMTGASGVLVAASAARLIVMVSNAEANAAAAIDPTGGTCALTAGIPVPAGATVTITGKAAQSAMTQIGTNTQVLTVYTG
jgi:hypothetical protein